MKNLKTILLLTIFCMLFPAAFLHADMYSWTDKDGVRHFTNTPPPKDLAVGNIEAEEEIETAPSSSDSVDTDRGEQPSENDVKEDTDENVSNPNRVKSNQKVVMYITSGCGWCKRAKAFFQKHDVQYIAYDIKKSKEAYLKYKVLKGSGVPLILIGEKKITGFNKKAISVALGLN